VAETLKLEKAEQRICSGEEEQFFERIDRQSGKLYSIAYSYLRNEADALEMLQEASYRSWSKRGSLKNDQLFDSWLIRILINCCMDELRRRKRVIPVEQLGEDRNAPGMAQMQSSDQLDLEYVLNNLWKRNDDQEWDSSDVLQYRRRSRIRLRDIVFRRRRQKQSGGFHFKSRCGIPATSRSRLPAAADVRDRVLPERRAGLSRVEVEISDPIEPRRPLSGTMKETVFFACSIF